MKQLNLLVLPLLASITLTGCVSFQESNPVIFGQTQSVGVNIGLSQVNQTPELSLGYRDFNIAILPTVAREADGTIKEVIGSNQVEPAGAAEGEAPSEDSFSDTYSVLGQFDVASSGEPTSAEAGLGKFFATGLAARVLSAGFACSLAKGTLEICQGRSNWPGSQPAEPASE